MIHTGGRLACEAHPQWPGGGGMQTDTASRGGQFKVSAYICVAAEAHAYTTMLFFRLIFREGGVGWGNI